MQSFDCDWNVKIIEHCTTVNVEMFSIARVINKCFISPVWIRFLVHVSLIGFVTKELDFGI